MGEQNSARKMAVGAVAAACQEAVEAKVGPVGDGMRVHTPGGVFSVRWDERESVNFSISEMNSTRTGAHPVRPQRVCKSVGG